MSVNNDKSRSFATRPAADTEVKALEFIPAVIPAAPPANIPEALEFIPAVQALATPPTVPANQVTAPVVTDAAQQAPIKE